MKRRNLEYIEPEKLRPCPENPRKHSRRQLKTLAKSIDKIGWTAPILIDEEGKLLAGHARLEAAKMMQLETVPCIRIDGLSADQKRAYRIADNSIGLASSWDVELLASDFEMLELSGFDLELTGFELADIDAMRCEADEASPKPSRIEDDHPLPDDDRVITRLGDLWILGRHKLLCGDAKRIESIEALMGDDQADLVFTDAPYNVPIQGHVSGLGRVRHREFVEASGEMTVEEFTAFLRICFSNLASACRDGAIVYTCTDWRHLREMLTAGESVFSELKNLCVWTKTNGGMGTFYRSQHELVLVWKLGTAPHTNTFGLGDKGRYRTNVWSYAGVNSFRRERNEELSLHPTVKPVALVADAIRDCSNRGEVILDVFGGSGTTLIAAHKTGRCARLLELDPVYCDIIVKRWEKLTGKEAVLASTERTFEDMAEVRSQNKGWPMLELAR